MSINKFTKYIKNFSTFQYNKIQYKTVSKATQSYEMFIKPYILRDIFLLFNKAKIDIYSIMSHILCLEYFMQT